MCEDLLALLLTTPVQPSPNTAQTQPLTPKKEPHSFNLALLVSIAVNACVNHILEVRAERVAPDRFCKHPNCVHRDPRAAQSPRVCSSAARTTRAVGWPRHEGIAAGMSRAAEGADDDGLDLQGRSVDESGECLHKRVEVLLDGVAQDFERRIQCRTRLPLSSRIGNLAKRKRNCTSCGMCLLRIGASTMRRVSKSSKSCPDEPSQSRSSCVFVVE